MWGLISGLVLLAVIIVLLYRSRQHEVRNKKMMTRQAANLDELNKFKDKIFSVLSHDLSGPVHSLSMLLTLLEENFISEKEFNELKPEVHKQLNAVTFLLDNLLQWSRSNITGKMVAKQEKVDLFTIADENKNLIQSSADRKNVTITNNIPQHLTATADSGQIDIVIRNLLANALKFTKAGGKITLSGVSDGDHVKISITDTGIGMSREQLDKLFTASANNYTYGTGGEKGIGLGLLLCYDFVKANHGSIEAKSELGSGSSFIVTLRR
jgi:signal transduction histidine kinase